MTDNIMSLPIKKSHRRAVTAFEANCQGGCPDEMVWDLCCYLRDLKACDECPRHEIDPDHGPFQRGCYALAHEAGCIALVWQKRIADSGWKRGMSDELRAHLDAVFERYNAKEQGE
jgi:hypothetical protein